MVSAGVTVMDKACVAVCAAGLVLSMTFTVKLVEPVLVGAPLMVPLGASERPAGRAPDTMLQVYGALPPEAVSVGARGDGRR
jgi:hypothetical protein